MHWPGRCQDQKKPCTSRAGLERGSCLPSLAGAAPPCRAPAGLTQLGRDTNGMEKGSGTRPVTALAPRVRAHGWDSPPPPPSGLCPKGCSTGTPKPSATGSAVKTGLRDRLRSWISSESQVFSAQEASVPSVPRVRARQEHMLTEAQHGGWSPTPSLITRPSSDKGFC